MSNSTRGTLNFTLAFITFNTHMWQCISHGMEQISLIASIYITFI